MTINAATPIIGATTYVAPTGGSADVLSAFGSRNEMVAYVDSETEVLSRRELSFTIKEPSVASSAPGGFTQARRTVMLKTPKVLANDNRTMNTASVQLAVDPETTVAEIKEIILVLSQVLGDTDFAAFWQQGILE